ncbi:MAG: putative 2OG-Fe(II) oxygenase [Pseudomonadota bacterium]
MAEEVVTIDGKEIPVWPEGQEIEALDKDRKVLRTRFKDQALYTPGLITRLQELAARPEHAKQRSRSLGGTKLYAVHEFNCPEADLIDARAVALFRRALGVQEAAVDMSWANIYGRGDYIMPHSHVRTLASVVYGVTPGDPDLEKDPDSGALAIVDPRYPPCCQVERGRLSNPQRFKMHAGTMVIFPGDMVHCVNPYNGEAPRISIAWNMNRRPQPGSLYQQVKKQEA